DMVKGMIGFDPVVTKKGGFRCFWSLDSGWGTFRMEPGRAKIEVLRGSLEVATLKLPFAALRSSGPSLRSTSLARHDVSKVSLGGKPVEFAARAGRITFRPPVRIEPGRKLVVTF
ncbi:unnamed protein product, partial [marine sediment metagenome]